MQIVIITLFPLPLAVKKRSWIEDVEYKKADRHGAAAFDPELQTFIIVKLAFLTYWA